MFTNPFCFTAGRFLVGIASGISNNVMGKSLDETVPSEVSQQFGILIAVYIVLGFTACYALGFILPTEENLLAEDERWRIILFMPAVIAAISILALFLVYREEPIAFNIAKGNDSDAKKLLRKVYKSENV